MKVSQPSPTVKAGCRAAGPTSTVTSGEYEHEVSQLVHDKTNAVTFVYNDMPADSDVSVSASSTVASDSLSEQWIDDSTVESILVPLESNMQWRENLQDIRQDSNSFNGPKQATSSSTSQQVFFATRNSAQKKFTSPSISSNSRTPVCQGNVRLLTSTVLSFASPAPLSASSIPPSATSAASSSVSPIISTGPFYSNPADQRPLPFPPSTSAPSNISTSVSITDVNMTTPSSSALLTSVANSNKKRKGSSLQESVAACDYLLDEQKMYNKAFHEEQVHLLRKESAMKQWAAKQEGLYWILRREAFKAELLATGKPVPNMEAFTMNGSPQIDENADERKSLVPVFFLNLKQKISLQLICIICF
jgi:hypothetical protein